MSEKKIVILVSKNGKRIILGLGVIMAVAVLASAMFFKHGNSPLLREKAIIIDPAHGGADSGETDYSTFFEKDVNLQISTRLQKELLDANALADVTRDGDYSLDIEKNEELGPHKRDLMARVNKFNSGKYHIFISIHVNRSSNTNAMGPIVLYSNKYPSTELLAFSVQNRLNQYIRKTMGMNITHKAALSDYYLLVNSDIPGIIIETGFISNPKEKLMLTDEKYQSKLVQYVKEGLEDYFKAIQDINRQGSQNRATPEDKGPMEEGVPSNAPYELHIVLK